MTRLATSFVLGYHGCDAEIAERAVSGEIDLLWSEKSYDWLGSGIYFWESDPDRAQKWAIEQVRRGKYKKAAVIGAAIDLGECLDLNVLKNIALLKESYDQFRALTILSGDTMPENKGAGSTDKDRLRRYLDRAVINNLHEMIADMAENGAPVQPFDTVRGMFTEGEPVYPGCGFTERAHVQIAVRNHACIKGIFFPR